MALLDSARTLLDSLDVQGTIETITKLLDWSAVPVSAGAARRERCRLVSYAAIIHGAALLPHLTHIIRQINPLLGDQEPHVAEEILRTVGNLGRYVLETHGSGNVPQPDALSVLFAPLLGAAATLHAGYIAIHRALLSLPHDLLRAEAILPTARALVKQITSLPQPPPAEAFTPLTRAAQHAGVHLPEMEVHLLVKCGVNSLRADDAARQRGAVELLRAVAPMLRAREADDGFAHSLTSWVADEVSLLPAEIRQQLAVQDLAAAYAVRAASPTAECSAQTAMLQRAEDAVHDLVHAICASTCESSSSSAQSLPQPAPVPVPPPAPPPPTADLPSFSRQPPPPQTELEIMERMVRLEHELHAIPLDGHQAPVPQQERTRALPARIATHAANAAVRLGDVVHVRPTGNAPLDELVVSLPLAPNTAEALAGSGVSVESLPAQVGHCAFIVSRRDGAGRTVDVDLSSKWEAELVGFATMPSDEPLPAFRRRGPQPSSTSASVTTALLPASRPPPSTLPHSYLPPRVGGGYDLGPHGAPDMPWRQGGTRAKVASVPGSEALRRQVRRDRATRRRDEGAPIMVQIYAPREPPPDSCIVQTALAAAAKAEASASAAAKAAEHSAAVATAALEGMIAQSPSVVPALPEPVASQQSADIGESLANVDDAGSCTAGGVAWSVDPKRRPPRRPQRIQPRLDAAAAAAEADAVAAGVIEAAAMSRAPVPVPAAPSPARNGGDSQSVDPKLVDVYLPQGGAVAEAAIIGQLRSTLVQDLRFDASAAPSAPPHATPTALVESLTAHVEPSKRDALSALLSLRAKEIEDAQRERCARASRQLVISYQQQVARLQATLVTKLGELGEAAQKNVEGELQQFMRLGLPAIQATLTDSAALVAHTVPGKMDGTGTITAVVASAVEAVPGA